MAEEWAVPKISLHYEGLFDYDEFYQLIVEWFKNNGYELQQPTYKHSIPSPEGAEQELEFSAEKRVTESIKHSIFLAIHFYALNEIEIIKEETKKILTKGRLELNIEGKLIIDWQEMEKSRITKFLRNVYNKYIARRELEMIYYDALYYKIYGLQTKIKQFLDLQAKWSAY